MITKLIVPVSFFALMVSGCATVPMESETVLGTADLSRSDGTRIGSVRLLGVGNELVVSGTLTGLPAGQHGFHLHTTGRCDAPDFQSAGGHLNPYAKSHGKLDPQGKHLGDLDNIMVPASGTVTVRQSVGTSMEADLARVFDGDGTSVMVHSGADDYRTDPSGDAGSRIACGIMQRAG